MEPAEDPTTSLVPGLDPTAQAPPGSPVKTFAPIPKSSVYTRTGDFGETSLFNGERRRKRELVFDVLGSVDELNSQVGVAIQWCVMEKNGLEFFLEEVQCRLLDMGTHCATPLTRSSPMLVERAKFPEEFLRSIEEQVDMMDYQLPRLNQFVLPGGGMASAHLHVCRTISRRIERYITGLLEEDEVDPVAFKVMNRLSDFFFVAARYALMMSGGVETMYKKGRGTSKRTLKRG